MVNPNDRLEAIIHYGRMLETLGVQPGDVETLRTPERHIDFLIDALETEHFDFTTFPAEPPGDMVIQENIPFFSLCKHHVLPFFGVAVVAYVPDKKVAGLSKLARAVQYCAKGLQTQESITKSVAEFLEEKLGTSNVAVMLRAMHMCMTLRGVKVHDTWTTTTCLKGSFLTAPTRAEFLSVARKD